MIDKKRRTFFITCLVISFCLLTSFIAYKSLRASSIHIDNNRLSLPLQKPPEPILALARQWLPSDIFRLLLPISFSIPKPRATPPESSALIVTDIQFLGVMDDWKKAKAVAIAVPVTTASPFMGNVLSSTDNINDLKAIRDRLIKSPGSPDWLVVMSVTATWTPWHLSLSIQKAEIGKRANALSAPPAYVEDALLTPDMLPTLFDVSLAQIPVPIDLNHTLNLNVAMSFGADTITFGFLPSDTAASFKAPPAGLQGLSIDTNGATTDTSFIVSIPHSFVNNILTTIFQNTPIPIGSGITVSSLSSITFTDPNLCPNSCLTILGDLNNSGGTPAVRVAIDWSGTDLKFLNARVDKNLCPGNPECQLLELTARTGVLKIKRDFTNPTPRLLRPKSVREIGKLSIAGKPLTLTTLILNTHVTSSGMSLSGFATLLTNKND